MRKSLFFLLLLFAASLFASCDKDEDDNSNEPVVEEPAENLDKDTVPVKQYSIEGKWYLAYFSEEDGNMSGAFIHIKNYVWNFQKGGFISVEGDYNDLFKYNNSEIDPANYHHYSYDKDKKQLAIYYNNAQQWPAEFSVNFDSEDEMLIEQEFITENKYNRKVTVKRAIRLVRLK